MSTPSPLNLNVISPLLGGRYLAPGRYMKNEQLIRAGAVKNSGLGYHIDYLKENHPSLIVAEAKYRTAEAYLYVLSANLPKISITFLYCRLFPPSGVRIFSFVLIGILIITTIVEISVLFSMCRPFAANWNTAILKASCMNISAIYAWASLPNIITDMIMLILPLPMIWKLHTNLQTKIQLTVTFVIGSM